MAAHKTVKKNHVELILFPPSLFSGLSPPLSAGLRFVQSSPRFLGGNSI
jgi:hypothetical protein